jgi:hypothetical protein
MLRHGIKGEVFLCNLAVNAGKVLRGESTPGGPVRSMTARAAFLTRPSRTASTWLGRA